MQTPGIERSEEMKKKIERGVRRLKKQGYTGAHPLKSDKHERFCQEYLISLNQTKAAKAAGYADSVAGKKGSDLMAEPRVVIRIEYLKRKRQERMRLRQMRVVEELERIAFSNILDFCEVTSTGVRFKQEMNDVESELYKKAGVIQELSSEEGRKTKVGIKLYDKIQALDKLMRHLDLYERAKLQIEQEKLELQKMKQAPETVLVEDDGFIEAMGDKAEEIEDDIEIDTGEEEEE